MAASMQGWMLVGLICLTALCGAAHAQEVAAPAGGRPLLPDLLTLVEPRDDERVRFEIVDAGPGAPGFDRTLRLTSKRAGAEWEAGVVRRVPHEFKEGEALLLGLWVRTISTRDESQQGILNFLVAQEGRPWRQVVGMKTSFTDEWQHLWARGVSGGDFADDEMALKLFIGDAEQVIEVAGVELLSYGVGFDVETLPRTRVTYAGRERDAAWREAARERIRDLRTAPLTVRVIDRDGRPVEGAEVHVRLLRHAFDFGVQTMSLRLMADDERGRLWREKLPGLFNAATFGNDLKWEPWVGDWGSNFRRDVIMDALRWMRANNISFRGHAIVWPSYRFMPAFMKEKEGADPDPEALRALVLSRIDSVTGWTAGYVDEWDVINEPYDNHDLMDICGRDVMIEWFRRCRERLPEARLTLNDYAILTAVTHTPKHDFIEETVRYLLDGGAPLDVLGLQGHFGSFVPSPERMLSVLDRYGRLGPKIRVTEFTVGGDDEELKRDFTRDTLTVLYSHPAVLGWQTWWGVDRFVAEDGSLTPLGRTYADLVHGEWKTDETVATDAAGECVVRGHLGRYRVGVRLGERAEDAYLDLRKDSEPLIVTLP
jgi:GH35 family endo-1,4-beta-xylanase